VAHKRKQNGSSSVLLNIANEVGIKVCEQFSEELLLNYCRESKEIMSEHKCKFFIFVPYILVLSKFHLFTN